MEKDSSGKKRARGILELNSKYTALRGVVCTPTYYQLSLGARTLTLLSNGKCVCPNDLQTVSF